MKLREVKAEKKSVPREDRVAKKYGERCNKREQPPPQKKKTGRAGGRERESGRAALIAGGEMTRGR